MTDWKQWTNSRGKWTPRAHVLPWTMKTTEPPGMALSTLCGKTTWTGKARGAPKDVPRCRQCIRLARGP